MTKMLDILGDYLNLKKIKFCRLDGSMQFMDRQENIDTFNKDPEHKVTLPIGNWRSFSAGRLSHLKLSGVPAFNKGRGAWDQLDSGRHLHHLRLGLEPPAGSSGTFFATFQLFSC